MNSPLGNFASRINMNLREKKGCYSYGTYSQVHLPSAAGIFQVGGGVRTDATGPAVNEILNELEGLLANLVTAQELARRRDGLATCCPVRFETNANAVSNYSNVFTYDLGLDYYANYASRSGPSRWPRRPPRPTSMSPACWSSSPSATRPRSNHLEEAQP